MPPSSLLIVPNEIYFMSLVMYFPAIVNKKEVERLGRGAKKEIKKYTFAKMLRKYEQIYDEIC